MTTRPKPADQQPDWDDPGALRVVLAELRVRHPLVDSAECHALRGELALAAQGRAFVLQAGDCAEPFADSASERTLAKAGQLEALADMFEAVTDTPVTRIGRFAGQYAKPRSQTLELLPDGTVLPVFRGEAVNSPEASVSARRTDPRRLLGAYDHAAEALDALLLNPGRPKLPRGEQGRHATTYVSHEMLLLDFESALLRADRAGGQYASSAHMVWIGERTRGLDSAHLALAASITNPVGVKVGPTATAADIATIVDRLACDPGRLTLIVRMGADAIEDRFSALLDSLGERARRVLWMTDPMHGNTRRSAGGQKVRVLDEMTAEVRAFFTALTERGLYPGGLHLELTPDPVTECVEDRAALSDPNPLPHYMSTCDPRLNPRQAGFLVGVAASLAARRTSGVTR